MAPFGAAWDMAGRLRRATAHPYEAPVPVLCVGNLVAGGAGKTPTVLALCNYLAARGIAAHVVTRGYGGRTAGPARVDPSRDDADMVGDEALLLARIAPCWVARDRTAGVRTAAAAGAQAVLLDDGFQNPSVAKTRSLVVVDAAHAFGNGRVIPAGPLRENLERGLSRADAVVWLASEGEPAAMAPRVACPIVPAVLAPIGGHDLVGRRVVAFAGIGRPEKFFATLRRLGADVAGERSFPDHHRFRDGEIAGLRALARHRDALLVTTAKDFVRLPPAARTGIRVLEIEIRWSDPAALERCLGPVVAALDGRR
ncbi:MAG TPA: tetraacyldisaccharide 4'-kinase [Stellaceae bacterium]